MTPSSGRSRLAKQARGWGLGSLGGGRPSAATVARPKGYALETGDAACSKCGKEMTGGEGREGRGWAFASTRR